MSESTRPTATLKDVWREREAWARAAREGKKRQTASRFAALAFGVVGAMVGVLAGLVPSGEGGAENPWSAGARPPERAAHRNRGLPRSRAADAGAGDPLGAGTAPGRRMEAGVLALRDGGVPRTTDCGRLPAAPRTRAGMATNRGLDRPPIDRTSRSSRRAPPAPKSISSGGPSSRPGGTRRARAKSGYTATASAS